MHIVINAIDANAYEPYGQLVEPQAGLDQCAANQGTATRFLHAAQLINDRPHARPHLSVYRVSPAQLPLRLTLLERHPHSTQVFCPLGTARYLSIVAQGQDTPDLSTLRAFLVHGTTGISYRPGVWHHPLIALDRVTDFTCWVFEDGTAEDCEEVALTTPVTVVA